MLNWLRRSKVAIFVTLIAVMAFGMGVKFIGLLGTQHWRLPIAVAAILVIVWFWARFEIWWHRK